MNCISEIVLSRIDDNLQLQNKTIVTNRVEKKNWVWHFNKNPPKYKIMAKNLQELINMPVFQALYKTVFKYDKK